MPFQIFLLDSAFANHTMTIVRRSDGIGRVHSQPIPNDKVAALIKEFPGAEVFDKRTGFDASRLPAESTGVGSLRRGGFSLI